ncbi:MAG: helix-turn-helix domain-containing protein [Gemmataceae bacterium]|nr:helix-turn-helix domain-containing protein [Gemmataceae bacterium]
MIPTRAQASIVSRPFRAFGAGMRLQIVVALDAADALTAGGLSDAIGEPISAVNHHLAIMLRAGVVGMTREGRLRWFALADPGLRLLAAARGAGLIPPRDVIPDDTTAGGLS